jgi:hypothetical protein
MYNFDCIVTYICRNRVKKADIILIQGAAILNCIHSHNGGAL